MRDSVLYFQDGIDLDEIDFNGHFRWNHTPALGQARRKIHDAMFDYERALRDAHAEEEARLAKIEQERLEEERRERERREAEERKEQAKLDLLKNVDAIVRKQLGRKAKISRGGGPSGSLWDVKWKHPLTQKEAAKVRESVTKALARLQKDSRVTRNHPEGIDISMDDPWAEVFMSVNPDNPNYPEDHSWQWVGVTW